jgi:hypothetical protein
LLPPPDSRQELQTLSFQILRPQIPDELLDSYDLPCQDLLVEKPAEFPLEFLLVLPVQVPVLVELVPEVEPEFPEIPGRQLLDEIRPVPVDQGPFTLWFLRLPREPDPVPLPAIGPHHTLCQFPERRAWRRRFFQNVPGTATFISIVRPSLHR